MLSVCIAQTNTTGEERSELIQKIKAAVIQVVNEYYQTKLEADKISVGKIDSSDDVIELTVNLPDDQKDGEGEGEGEGKEGEGESKEGKSSLNLLNCCPNNAATGRTLYCCGKLQIPAVFILNTATWYLHLH